MTKDIHASDFDEATLAKLELFERYAESWLPVFVARDRISFPQVNLIDFFAGAGTDASGTPGSPLRLLKVIEAQRGRVARPSVTVNLFLSDSDRTKVAKLRELTAEDRFRKLPIPRPDIKTATFEARFPELLPTLKRRECANLLIIDQYGIKEMTEDVFSELVSIPTTDFLFFVSSSTFYRFKDLPAIAKFSKYERPEDYKRAHISLFEVYKGWLPTPEDYYLSHFSIKKGSNIYGVIFGSAHPLGMAKFLDVCWKLDPAAGRGNFDVLGEGLLGSTNEFLPGFDTSVVVTEFEQELRQLLSTKSIENELDVLRLCFKHGVKPQHARPVLDNARRTGLLSNQRPRWVVPDPKNHRKPRVLTY